MSTAEQAVPTVTADRAVFPLRTARSLVLAIGVLLFAGAFFALRLTRDAGVVNVSEPPVADTVEIEDPGSAGVQPIAAPEPEAPDPAFEAPILDDAMPVVLDVEASLAAAEVALGEGSLVGSDPPGALRLARAILTAAPENEDASETLDAAAAAAMRAVESALQRRELGAASTLIGELKLVGVSGPEVEVAEKALGRLRQVSTLESRASVALESGRLMEPEGRNAASYFQELLTLEPDNQAASNGLRLVQKAVVDRVLNEARAGRFAGLDATLARARSIWVNPDLVLEAEIQVAQLRSRRAERLAAQAREAMAGSDFGRAQSLIAQVASVSDEPGFEAILQGELANARLYSIYQPGDVFFDSLLGTAGTGPAMVVVPVGQFRMGSASKEAGRSASEGPVHTVTFGTGFAIARTEITVAQFRTFVMSTGYETEARREGHSFVYADSTGRVTRRRSVTWRNDFAGHDAPDSAPVIHVSWNDANAYAQWLSEETGYPYRLPSEAEFEYANRAGTTGPFWWGSESPDPPVTNLAGDGDVTRRRRRWDEPFQSYGDGFWGPAPVGSFLANPYGLYDMSGNVSEWVADCWHGSYARAPRDGTSWVNIGCDRRVARGGFWGSSPTRTRSAYRMQLQSTQLGPHLGFRVARKLVIPPKIDE